MMDNRAIVVPVRMDAAIFREFAAFDTLRRQRRWVSPAVFSLILLVSAVLCFMQAPREGAILLGAVLCVVALALPLVYFGMFFRSVRQQSQKMGLATPRAAYTLRLSDAADGVAVTAAGKTEPPQETRLAWAALYGAWRTEGAIYLYAAPGKAYILPAEQVQGGAAALWALCQKMLPAEKCHDTCKK